MWLSDKECWPSVREALGLISSTAKKLLMQCTSCRSEKTLKAGKVPLKRWKATLVFTEFIYLAINIFYTRYLHLIFTLVLNIILTFIE